MLFMNAIPQIKDPVIQKQKAIEKAGSKANLARILGIARSCVTEWGDELPTLQAYRLLQIYPELEQRWKSD